MPTEDDRAPYLTEHAHAELDALDRAREERWTLTERGREALERSERERGET